MHLRHRLKIGQALAAAGLVMLLASCETIDQALLPGGAETGRESGGGQSQVETREPLVIIRFDQADVAYEAPLFGAVNAALARKPDAAFDVVAVTPGEAPTELDSERGRRNAEMVAKSLGDFGVPLDRVTLSAAAKPDVQVDEVYVYVR